MPEDETPEPSPRPPMRIRPARLDAHEALCGLWEAPDEHHPTPVRDEWRLVEVDELVVRAYRRRRGQRAARCRLAWARLALLLERDTAGSRHG